MVKYAKTGWIAAVSVLAVSAAPLKAADDVCRGDVAKYCGQVVPGRGRVRDCLNQHQTELSSGCAAQWSVIQEQWSQVTPSCKPDADLFCGDILPGQGGIFDCLRDHTGELSKACQDDLSMDEHPPNGNDDDASAVQQPCIDDIRKACQDVPSGDGRLTRCLEEHQDALSLRCRDALRRRR